MDLKELKELIKLCKKSGLLKVKVDNVELEFAEHAVTPTTRRSKKSDSKETTVTGIYSEEDALFWSVPGVELSRDEAS